MTAVLVAVATPFVLSTLFLLVCVWRARSVGCAPTPPPPLPSSPGDPYHEDDLIIAQLEAALPRIPENRCLWRAYRAHLAAAHPRTRR